MPIKQRYLWLLLLAMLLLNSQYGLHGDEADDPITRGRPPNLVGPR